MQEKCVMTSVVLLLLTIFTYLVLSGMGTMTLVPSVPIESVLV